MQNSARHGLAALAAVMWVGCHLPRQPVVYGGLDRSHPLPQGRPKSPWVRPRAKQADGSLADDPADCGPRTGKTADGTCVFLTSEALGVGERVLLPRGEVIVGGVPSSYSGKPSASGTPRIRYRNQPLRKEPIASFWIDVVEVQRADYRACVDAGRCTAAQCPGGSLGVPQAFAREAQAVLDGLPQTCVSYEQAQSYCQFRQGELPTLSQWTYAARGPSVRAYSWGPNYSDDFSMGMMPVSVNRDRSYFGIVGMSSGAEEILRGTPQLDESLAPWITAPFRSPTSPFARHFDAWIRRYACPGKALGTACRRKEEKARHWVSARRLDAFRWAWSGPAADADVVQGPDGERPMSFPNEEIGFRCVYPRAEGEPDLALPKETLSPPDSLTGQGLALFVGAAEAVNFAEAKAFCASVVLAADRERAGAGAWRLPTAEELPLVESLRVGPGPLWLADGRAARAEPDEQGELRNWIIESVDRAKTATIARCVR